MRRTIILAAAALAAVASFGLSGSTAPTGNGATTARDLARQLLANPNVRLSGLGGTALNTIAAGSHAIEPAEPGVNPDQVPASTGGYRHNEKDVILANRRVNDPAADSHQPDQTTQSETTIAVSGNNVAVGYNDSQQSLLFLTAGSNLSGYSYSTDRGIHFTDGGDLPNHPAFVNLGDPWMAADRSGRMYYSTLMLSASALQVGTATSDDGGKTWTTPQLVEPRAGLNEFYLGDKDSMTVGPDPAHPSEDNVYVTWDDFLFKGRHFFTGLPVSHSYNGGKTWSLVYADRNDIDPEGCSFAQYFGAQPVVDPADGTLYVFSEKFSVDNPKCRGHHPLVISEVVTKSTDGGQTFSPVTTVAVIQPANRFDLLNLGFGRFMRLAEFPSPAILNGNLYVVWNEGQQDGIHIRVARSTNGGDFWFTSNATSGFGDEVQPALSADADGLHLLYYERNEDDTLDVYVANSADGSQFAPSKVTTQSFPGVFTAPQFDPIIAWGYMGDYIANVSDGTRQYFAWGDNRDIVTDFLFPDGRNDPDVFFASR